MLKTNFEIEDEIMIETGVSVVLPTLLPKEQKVINDPRLSLKQFAAYPLATVKGKQSILKKAKFPGGYIPKFYEQARKIICNTLSANFGDYDFYLSEFNRQARVLLDESINHERDEKKNRVCSSNALLEMQNLAGLLMPIINKYTLNSNIRNTRDHLYVQEVRIGCMADLLLYEYGGATFTGLLKFNFTKSPLKKKEAEYMLYCMKRFFEKKNETTYQHPNCMLIDVFSNKLYISNKDEIVGLDIKNACREIYSVWNSIPI